MEWDKLFDKAKGNKVDAATILICGAVGFIGDAVSTFHGVISPGYFAGLAASGGLGVKNLISAGIDFRRNKEMARQRGPIVLAKANELLPIIAAEPNLKAEADRLNRSIELFSKQILSIEDFEKNINEAADKYLKL